MRIPFFPAAFLLWSLVPTASDQLAGMVKIEGGTLYPFYPPSPKEKEIPVKSFNLDKKPVTNSDFLDFVLKNPAWRRDRIKKIFADDRYLSHWNSPSSLGKNAKPQQ